MVLATACIGKVLGTFVVAKLWGVENRKAIALGFLMNTKGLVELIVLNIGLSKGVRSLRPHSDCTTCYISYSFLFVLAKNGMFKSFTNCSSTKKSDDDKKNKKEPIFWIAQTPAGYKSRVVCDNGDHGPCDHLHDNSSSYVDIHTSS